MTLDSKINDYVDGGKENRVTPPKEEREMRRGEQGQEIC